MPLEHFALPDKSAARVQEGPQQRGQQGRPWRQDLDEGALEHLVPIEGKVLRSAGHLGSCMGWPTLEDVKS